MSENEFKFQALFQLIKQTRTSRARHGGRRIRSLNDPIEPNNLTQSNLNIVPVR